MEGEPEHAPLAPDPSPSLSQPSPSSLSQPSPSSTPSQPPPSVKKIINLQGIKHPRVDDSRPLHPLDSSHSFPDPPHRRSINLRDVKRSTTSRDNDEATRTMFPPSRHLWVGNLNTSVTQDQLIDRFSKYGKIESISKRQDRQYAFINYRTTQEATSARDTENNKLMFGAEMVIKFGKGTPNRGLWVGNVDSSVSEDHLYFVFKRYGAVERVRQYPDHNCAIIKFENEDDAVQAMDHLQDTTLAGGRMRINFASHNEMEQEGAIRNTNEANVDDDGGRSASDRRRGRSRSRDNSRSRGRSRSRSALRLRDGSRDRSASRSRERSDRSRGGDGRRDEWKDGDSTRHLWIGNIDNNITTADLEREFGRYRDMEKARVFYGRGYGFVDFRTISAAVYARKQFNGRHGWIVNYARGQPSRHLWIGSIHPNVDERQLIDVFSKFGPIEQCKKLQRSNCAFVDFDRIDSAIAAINEMQGAILGGYEIKIDFGVTSHALPTTQSERSYEHDHGHDHEHEHEHEHETDATTPRRSLYISFPRDGKTPTERELFEEFVQFSRVVSVKIVPELHYAFVNFDLVDDARAALEKCKGRVFQNPDIKVYYARNGKTSDYNKKDERDEKECNRVRDSDTDRDKDNRDKDREVERHKTRDRDKTRDKRDKGDRDHDRDKQKDRNPDRERERERERDRDRDRERDRDRDHNRRDQDKGKEDRGLDRDHYRRDQDKGTNYDRGREHNRDHDRNKDRNKGGDRERDKIETRGREKDDRDSERDRNKDRDRDTEREKNKDRERAERDREHNRNKDRDKDVDRGKGTHKDTERNKAGETDLTEQTKRRSADKVTEKGQSTQSAQSTDSSQKRNYNDSFHRRPSLSPPSSSSPSSAASIADYCRSLCAHDRSPCVLLRLLGKANVDVRERSSIIDCINKALHSFQQLNEDLQLELTQNLVHASMHANNSDAKRILPVIYDMLASYIPTTPEPASSRAYENETTEPKLNFSIIEASLLIFHVLASKAAESLQEINNSKADPGQPTRKKVMETKFLYLEERTKSYIQVVELTYNSFANSAVLSAEGLHKKSIISVALQATKNVLLLVQNLLRRHPDLSSTYVKGIVVAFSHKDANPMKALDNDNNYQKEGEKRKRGKDKGDNVNPHKREKTEEHIVNALATLPPASPISPQGSPIVANIKDLPQVWRGSLGKGDAAVCRIFAKQIDGPPLNDETMQILKGTGTLAVKDRTPIGDLSQYLNQGRLAKIAIFYFQPEHEADNRPLVEFIHYLKSKDRAGISRLSLNKIMYMVPSSTLASFLLSLTHTGYGNALIEKEDILLGVIETENDKPLPSGLSNPVTFPLVPFPNMLNMHNFGVPNVAMLNLANLSNASTEVPSVTSPKLLQNIPSTTQSNINFANLPNFPNFSGMVPMNMLPFAYMQNLAALQQSLSQSDVTKN